MYNNNIILLFLLIYLFIFLNKNTKKNYYNKLKNELNDKINILQTELKKQNKTIDDLLKFANNQTCQLSEQTTNIINRDYKTINDKLYPLLNRVEEPIAESIINNPYFNIPSRFNNDNFRAMAIVREQKNGNLYYLMGRQKYHGSNLGEFYLISPDRDKGIKIPLSSDPNTRVISDYYSLPYSFTIKDGIFAGSTYDVQELKNSDLTSRYF